MEGSTPRAPGMSDDDTELLDCLLLFPCVLVLAVIVFALLSFIR